MKQVQRDVFEVAHPFEAAESVAENALLDAASGRGRNRRRTAPAYGPSQASIKAYERDMRREEKEAEIARISDIERRMVSVHLRSYTAATHREAAPAERVDPAPIRDRVYAEFAVAELEQRVGGGAERPRAPEPVPVDRNAMLKAARAERLKGVSFFSRRQRAAAKARAAQDAAERAAAEEASRQARYCSEQAELDELWRTLQQRKADADTTTQREIERERQRRQLEHDRHQAELDRQWQALVSNDPDTVRNAVRDARRTSDVDATVIDCTGTHVTVAFNFGDPDILPGQVSAVTPAGRPTLHKRNKVQRNELYVRSMASIILAVARATFAACPGIDHVRPIVVRDDLSTSCGLAAVYAGTLQRDVLDHLDWTAIDPLDQILAPNDALISRKGRAQELVALDLENAPDVSAQLERAAETWQVSSPDSAT